VHDEDGESEGGDSSEDNGPGKEPMLRSNQVVMEREGEGRERGHGKQRSDEHCFYLHARMNLGCDWFWLFWVVGSRHGWGANPTWCH
jgi:hypothetical protein